jgi:hypothetical protein
MVTVTDLDCATEALSHSQQCALSKISKIFVDFADTSFTNAVYLPNLKGFWAINMMKFDPSKFFSFKGMKFLFENLGIHAGWQLDRLLVQRAAKCMNEFFNEFVGHRSLQSWLTAFFEKDVLPSETTNPRMFATSCNEFLKLGVCLQLRCLLRSAIGRIFDEKLPGFRHLTKSAVLRKQSPRSDLEALIIEFSDVVPEDLTYVKKNMALIHGEYPLHPNVNWFIFFIALHFNLPKWDNVRHMPQYDAFTENLHLFPVATNAFLNALEIFFEPAVITEQKKMNAFVIFFATMAQIIAVKRAKGMTSSANALTILADLYPKFTNLDYGRIEQSFPTRLVNSAYAAGAGGIRQKK